MNQSSLQPHKHPASLQIPNEGLEQVDIASFIDDNPQKLSTPSVSIPPSRAQKLTFELNANASPDHKKQKLCYWARGLPPGRVIGVIIKH
jgi:hypothetical protein